MKPQKKKTSYTLYTKNDEIKFCCKQIVLKLENRQKQCESKISNKTGLK